jgi:hypothetical protein
MPSFTSLSGAKALLSQTDHSQRLQISLVISHPSEKE